jgi:AraC-like DNA-binding protein
VQNNGVITELNFMNFITNFDRTNRSKNMPTSLPKKILARQHEIFADYLRELDKHLDDVVHERVEVMLEVRDFAELLHIHPTHLTNTIKQTTGKSP